MEALAGQGQVTLHQPVLIHARNLTGTVQVLDELVESFVSDLALMP